jgi:predicted transcriptional regulator
MKVLQNGRIVRFLKRTDCWCTFNWSICNINSHLLGVSRAAVSKVMTAYTNHRKTSSAERSSGQKPKLIERDLHTLRIVSENHRTAVAKVTAELNIHLEDPVATKKVRQELHKSNILSRAAVAKPFYY